MKPGLNIMKYVVVFSQHRNILKITKKSYQFNVCDIEQNYSKYSLHYLNQRELCWLVCED